MTFLPPYQQLLQHSNLRFSKDIYQKAYYAFKPKELYIIDSEYPVYSSNSNDGNADINNLDQNNISDSIPNKNVISTKGIFGNNFQQFTYNNTYNRAHLTDNRFSGYIPRNPQPTTLSVNTYNVDTDENYQTPRPDTIPEQNNENEENNFHQETDNPINPPAFHQNNPINSQTQVFDRAAEAEVNSPDSGNETMSIAAEHPPAKSFIIIENETGIKRNNIPTIQNYIIELKKERGIGTPLNTGFEIDGDKYIFVGHLLNKKPKVVVYKS